MWPIATEKDLGGIRIGTGLQSAADGTVSVIGGGGNGVLPGNPLPVAVSIGSAVNDGSAATYMRSDVVLGLDQGMSPQWTSAHTFLADINFGASPAASLGLEGTSLKYTVASGTHEFAIGSKVVASVQDLTGVDFDRIPDDALVDWATVKRYVASIVPPLPDVVMQVQKNFASADGVSAATLQVNLKDPSQSSTVTFKEATGTVKFDPASVAIGAGKTVPVTATSKVAGAFFVSVEVGTAEPVEIDFLAAKPWPPTASTEYPSTSEGSPTLLVLANEFYDLSGNNFSDFYVKLPLPSAQPFVSIFLSSTGWALENTLHFSTSEDDSLSQDKFKINLPGTDMTPADSYMGAFYSVEKNEWFLYQSGDAIFGITDS